MKHQTRGGWDVHTHLFPRGLVEAAAAGHFGMSLTDKTVAVPGLHLPRDAMGNPARLLARIDTDDLDGAVVSVPPPLFRADLEFGARKDYCWLINDGLLETVAAAPNRLRPLAYLPTDVPELALAIAQSLDRRWAGVIVGTELAGGSYADPVHHDLWRVLEDAKLPVLLHPSESGDQRLKPFYLSNLLGNPFETALAAAGLIFGDVVGTFPSLQFILSHGGGVTPALIGRWQRGVTSGRSNVGELTLSPLEALRRLNVDSIVHSGTQLAATVELVGSERLLLGSDWPFPMGTDSADHDMADLEPELIGRARVDNPMRVFGDRLANPSTV